jgi:RNA polymerase sigma factor (sigma-70 family)
MEEQFIDEMTDQSLMLAVREGDVEKLGVLFERYHRQLFNFLFRLTGNRHLSEDLVQEVFVRILKYRHTYRNESQFTTWMFQIARNARIDYLRQSSPEEANVDEHAAEFVSPAPTPAESVEKQDEIRIILEALAKLSEERREVLLLRGFHGLKFEEIAEVTACSVNTIKGRAFRAIRELRAAVQKLKAEKVV